MKPIYHSMMRCAMLFNIVRYCMFLNILFISLVVRGQQVQMSKQPAHNLTIKSLKVGDKVPDLVMAKLINYKNRLAKTSDFKDRLLILDFWDTYCGSCIEALPGLDSLQRIFDGKVTIMPVTYQPEGLVRTFFKNNNFVKNVQLPCVVEDQLLHRYFKHQLISHEVWIDKGVVKAITGMEYVTAANIRKILNGEKVDWPEKNDEFHFDPKTPIFSLNDPGKYHSSAEFKSYSGIAGYRKGIAINGLNYDSLLNRTYFFNFSIVDAYTSLLTQMDRKKFLVGPGRIVLEVKDPSAYRYRAENGFQEEWNEKHKFCYEMVSPQPLEKKERLRMVLNDLNNRLGLNGRFEKRLTKCLVLVPYAGKPDATKIINGRKITLRDLLFYELEMKQIYPPTLNESNFTGEVVIGAAKNLEDLRKQLQINGFDLMEAEREIEVLVITETR